MEYKHIARASVKIQAPVEEVWDALTNPEKIREYMYGAEVVSDWLEGSHITWKGKYNGKTFEDTGVVLKCEPPVLLQYSHFSPLSGADDKPENYHFVTIKLERRKSGTEVKLAQDNNGTEEVKLHSERRWAEMLGTMKQLIESTWHVKATQNH
jgi:uncharacterized protein YndB with AHSA1/START domain